MKAHRGIVAEHRTCSADCCEGEVKAKGYCEKHYRRLLKNGTVDGTDIRKVDSGDEVERFYKKLRVNEFDCWVWTGSLVEHKNFPRHWLDEGRYIGARKFSYQLRYKSSPKGALFSVKCSTDLCVNPDHIVIKTKEKAP